MSFVQGVLSDVADVIGRGITPKYAEDDGILVLNQRCVRDGRIDLACARLHDSAARKVRQDKVLREGDSLVNSTGVGTLGRTAYVSQTPSEMTVDSHVTVVRPKPESDPRWLGYAMRLAEPQIEAMAEGSTGQTELSRGRLADLQLTVPERGDQIRIAAALSALDDKIESNDRIIGLIPHLVRTGVDQAMATERVSVPVASLASFVNGGAFTKGATGSGRMVLRIAELNSGPGASTVYNDIIVPDEKLARPGDILMSWSGSLGVYRWYRDEAIINQHIFKVIPRGYPAWLVADRLEAVIGVFQGIAKDKATTMGHIQRGHLESTMVELPTNDALIHLDVGFSDLWERLLLAERENLHLARLRDALLPELLGGRLRVRPELGSLEAAR
jgi:type I restriction enzyme S subunit